MNEKKANAQVNLSPCAHCEATGSCHSAKDGASCLVCAQKARMKDLSTNHFGLVCSVCSGAGSAEPEDTVQIFGVLIALLLTFAAMGLVFFALHDPALDKILPFAASVIGSITGFFFGSRVSKGK